MKHDPNRIIDLEKVKNARRSKRKCLIALVVGLVILLLAGIGWAIFSQIAEVVQPGDFWANFSSVT